eukprot:Clim_evm4s236 gene=Clim_evmTU4s236
MVATTAASVTKSATKSAKGSAPEKSQSLVRMLALPIFVLAFLLQIVKPSWIVPTGKYIFDYSQSLRQPTQRARDTSAIDALESDLIHVEMMDPLRGFPLHVTPKTPGQDAEFLANYIKEHHDEFQNALTKHGVIRFRDFDVPKPKDFETVISTFDPWLNATYLGLANRPRIDDTEYVWTASEFPGYAMIGPHSEMAFLLDTSPKNVFFYARRVTTVGGETPLFDMAEVWDNMKPEVKEKFKQWGIKTQRKYKHRDEPSRDFLMYKTWQDLFNTEDKDEAFRLAVSEGLNPHWDGNTLILHDIYSGTTVHPVTGRTIFYNHCPAYHETVHTLELAQSAAREEAWYPAIASHIAAVVNEIHRWIYNDDVGIDCFYGNGEQIPWEDMVEVRAALWKYGVTEKHHEGDIVMVDNRQMGHSRNYFMGERSILNAWSTYPPDVDQSYHPPGEQ